MQHPPRNPFAVQTPETLSSDEMVKLFVEESSDFPQIRKPGHTMIFGPRGTGKSTIFRYMEPDCQVTVSGGDLSNCEYFAVSIPLKSTENLPEFLRLEKIGHGSQIISEHAIVCEVFGRFLFSLKNRVLKVENILKKPIECADELADAFLLLPDDYKIEMNTLTLVNDLFDSLKKLYDELRKANKAYLDKTSFSNKVIPYEGPIVGYNDFLKPLLSVFRKFEWMPDGPIYLLFDDAEQLGELQTKILNSWIAQRSTNDVCIKVTAQERKYKTFKTISSTRIEAPHDYSNVAIHTVFTSKSSAYQKQVRAIIKKRLELYAIKTNPEEFFPEDKRQVRRLDEIKKEIGSGDKAGYRIEDDVYRYARPKLFKELAGISKNSPTYSYSGFDQLVNLSDGLLRDFLDAASQMYANSPPNCDVISPSIQNQVMQKQAEEFLSIEFGKLEVNEAATNPRDKLLNLINAMGGLFRQILISEASERRVFSIAFSNGPDETVREIMELGAEHRYLKISTIGNKEGTGRVPLLILSRRLAPYFKLDPNGFSGYKFIQNDIVNRSLDNPKSFLNKIRNAIKSNPVDDLTRKLDFQGELFDER